MAKKRKKVLKKKTKKVKVKARRGTTPKKRAAVKPRKTGRKTKYQKTFPAMAVGFAEDGSFRASTLAKKFKVSIQTIRNWLEKYPEFAAAVEEGKEIAVDTIEQKYFQLAHGGLERTKTSRTPDEDGKEIKSETTETLFPSERACNKILTSQRAEEYKEKRELSGADGKPLQLNVTLTKTYKNDSEV